ncbi:MAG: PQQ-binding-like beta-propeller repeat protein, partial [Myxococcota bacterium]
MTDPARTWLGPVVVNGAVIGTANGGSDAVSSWDLATGIPLWTYNLQPSANPTGPTVVDGLVVVERINAGDAYVIALDEGLGTQQWRATVSTGPDRYRAPLAVDGEVYAAGGALGGVYGISAATGVVDWIAPGAEQFDDWTPVWGDGSVWVQVGDSLNELDPLTGNYLGAIVLPSGPAVAGVMGTVPAVEGAFALVVAGDDLVGVDLAAGAVAWTVEGGFSGSPTVADGLGYAIRDGFVQQFDLADGYLVREFTGDGGATGKVIVTDDVVLVGSATAVHV